MKVKSGVSPEAVNQGAGHTIFVEGSNQDAIDPRALFRLLRDTNISVKALGPSRYLKSAAQALHPHHPNYYFIIDRDHHEETTVTEAWNNFPDPTKYNLLIWRKRELENYFLDPEYLCRSSFLTRCSPADLKTRLLKLGEQRVFFDLANQTIAKVREAQKAKWIEDFSNPSEFKTVARAIAQLKSCPEFSARAASVSQDLNFSEVETNLLRTRKSIFSRSEQARIWQGQLD